MLTVLEAADYLRLSKRTLERLRCSGLGPKFVKCGCRSIRYRQSDLDDWISGRVVRSTSEELRATLEVSHYSEDMEQVELIRLVRAKLQQKGTLTKGLLFKICENKTNDQRKIWGAINHLVALGEAVEIAQSTVGRPTEGKWKWRAAFKEQ